MIVAAVLVIHVGLMSVVLMRRAERRYNSITKLWQRMESAADGRDYEITTGGNEAGEKRVMLIIHYTRVDPRRRVMVPGVKYSSSDPIPGIKPSGSVVARYPPDPQRSGLWVDGRRWRLTRPLTVVYATENGPAVEVVIPDEARDAFLRDAETMEGFAFISKWIEPRVPKATTRP